jgi:hypothetical protein
MHGEYNAIFLKTPDNSFDNNFEALVTLEKRLEKIKDMNESSFEYQTAIQQITAQEQGEANKMLSILKGTYFKINAFILWNWIGWINILIIVLFAILGVYEIKESQ